MYIKTFATAFITAAALGAMGCSTAASPKSTKTITLPSDTMQLKANDLPGYAKAQANCVSCHSAEYMQYQPPTAPRKYWEAMVNRMKTVFDAPIDEADAPLIVDYLVKTYGNEQNPKR